MIVVFEKRYLQELYSTGKSTDKKHRFQPEVVRKYIRIIDMMIIAAEVTSLVQFNSLHYKQLQGSKQGVSSVRVNDQYRIEFIEHVEDNRTVATICSIVELSNHYK